MLPKRSEHYEEQVLKELKSLKYEVRGLKQTISGLETKVHNVINENIPNTHIQANKFVMPVRNDEELSTIENTITLENNRHDLVCTGIFHVIHISNLFFTA